MIGWNTIAKFLFLWLLATLTREHVKFMKKKKSRWPFRRHETAT